MARVKTIRQKLTLAGKTFEEIGAEVGSLQDDVRDALNTLEDCLRR